MAECPEKSKKLATANGQFAVDLYQQLSSQVGNVNLFYSPISVSVAMAMTYLGAKGQTAKQMSEGLQFKQCEADLHACFNEAISCLQNTPANVTLAMANRLYGEETFKFLGEFLSATKKHYGAELAPVSFKSNLNGAVEAVNKWVSEQTRHKIPEIITTASVNSLTRLILVNAIYFKGDWKEKFDAKNTTEMDFHVDEKTVKKAQMMHLPGKNFPFGYNATLECVSAELPYIGNTLSMVFILPKKTSIESVEKKLTGAMLTNWREEFGVNSFELDLYIPKFKLDNKFSLVDPITNLGVTDLFSCESADLSGIDGSRELYVDNIFHRAYVEVNEEGAEAAAATAVVIQTRCAPMRQTFKADRPFLFFIRDMKSGTVLFLGKYVSP